ncbi:MAG TPA: alanine--tRNA ligase [Candidatus Sumerlaeota bacterium]|nr:alanine--tRNA ligase [Candidatus Sumerlaeota bacterium]
MLTAAAIRQLYIDFFVQRGHTHVSSAPMVPPDDPTLMFNVAGMVQFKALYSGSVPLPYTRAVTVQKCLRVADLENVGRTLRHHTFFEMLGNFSFGDYFKREAITWGWEFCTDPNWLGLPPERIFATVFGVQREGGAWEIDQVALDIWQRETGVVNGVTLLDEEENFWGPAGGTGACGACSEIKFFTGPEDRLREYQRLSRSTDPADQARMRRDIVEEGDLFLEIWNLVFPEFDQQLDGSRPLLKNRGIDTGAGLERTTTAVQFTRSGGRIRSQYETDLLLPMVRAVADVAGLPYPTLADGDDAEQSIRRRGLDPAVVRLAMNACADHARALTFTLSEGVVPSNEGRGYVLRRILRRAARFGLKLGITEPFLWRLVAPVVDVMGGAYPEITRHVAVVERTIRAEEERFTRTLNQGGQILDDLLARVGAGGRLAGEEAYRLYDTYGYPLDLTIEAAAEKGISVDQPGFDRALDEAKRRARASWKGGAGAARFDELLGDLPPEQRTRFCGYEGMACASRVVAILRDDLRVDSLKPGQNGVVVLDETPFYAEAGGQVGDTGALDAIDSDLALFAVEDTQKTEDGHYLHFGEARETIHAGQQVKARVDCARRTATMLNHSATHLMQGALKRLIGGHVTQQGSFVGPDGLRFDFTHPEPVPEATLREIERIVNGQILANLPVTTQVMALEEAKATGAIAPFGEKYGAQVRVIAMGDFSREFCGGTHVRNTGQIGLFLITGESSVASGIRRIEARTGLGALETVIQERQALHGLARQLSVPADGLPARIQALQDEIRQLRRQVEEAKAAQARRQMSEAAADFAEIAGIRYLAREIPGADHNALAQAWDALRGQSPTNTAVLFYSVADGKVSMIVGLTDDLAPRRLKAGDVLKETAAIVGGKGGGKPTLARGGGSQPENLPRAVEQFPSILQRLAG